tara:strand:+ start:2291 stop:3346 length:1056 start_codon:yes stop_codon:yes gene_type:complete
MIVIIQAVIPHYRENFFLNLKNKINFDLFSFNDLSDYSFRAGLNVKNIFSKKINLYQIRKFKWFNPLFFLLKYKTIIIPGELSILANWVILILGKVLNKNVIIWGHGVTYAKKNPINFGHFLMYYLSNGAIFYTSKEMRFWRKKFPNKKMIAYQNTLDVNLSYYNSLIDKKKIKRKYGIRQQNIFISCHRFSRVHRRHDHLINTIINSNIEKEAFIIIGSGKLKPDFSKYSNVFDFNQIYDHKIKSELFFISNFYIQFGWIGLSAVEAMAYHLPVITLRRSFDVRHSVEYFYLKNNYNAIILNKIEEFKSSYKIASKKYSDLSNNAFLTYDKKLNITNMVNNTYNYLLEFK